MRTRNMPRSHRALPQRFHSFSYRAVVWLIAVSATGCAPMTAPPPEEGVTDVAMQGTAFVPKEVTIKQGERVRWTNLESFPMNHTTTSGDPSDENPGELWNSGLLAPGESFTRQFDDLGEFEYHCIPHADRPAMRNAKVIVEP